MGAGGSGLLALRASIVLAGRKKKPPARVAGQAAIAEVRREILEGNDITQ